MADMKKTKLLTQDGMIEVLPRDLPSGSMLVRGPDGEKHYITSDLLCRRKEPVHPPFTGDRLARLKRIYAILKDVHPSDDFEGWHLNFRCDQNPENELALYEKIARVYRRLVNSATSLRRRRDIYRVIVALTLVDSVEALRANLGPTYYSLGVEKIAQIAQEWSAENQTYEAKVGHYRIRKEGT